MLKFVCLHASTLHQPTVHLGNFNLAAFHPLSLCVLGTGGVPHAKGMVQEPLPEVSYGTGEGLEGRDCGILLVHSYLLIPYPSGSSDTAKG